MPKMSINGFNKMKYSSGLANTSYIINAYLVSEIGTSYIKGVWLIQIHAYEIKIK